MEFSVNGMDWTITGEAADLASHVAVEVRGDKQFLALRPPSTGHLEALASPQFVEAGRAYRCLVSASPDMHAAHAELLLQWLDGEGQELGRERGPYVFMQHDLADKMVWGVAPAGSASARLVVRLVSDQTHSRRATGRVVVGAPQIQPSLALNATPGTDAALFTPDLAARYTISIAGGLPTMDRVTLQCSVSDYEGIAVYQKTDIIPLASGGATVALVVPPQRSGYYRLTISATGEGLAPATIWRSYASLPDLAFEPPRDYAISLDAGMSWPTGENAPRSANQVDAERLRIKCEAARRLGLRCLRDRWSWAETNAEPDVSDHRRYVMTAQAQQAAGLDVYQINHSTPLWALVPTADSVPRQAYPPRDPRFYYEGVRRMVRDLGGAVRYFEPWNEPDIFFFQGYAWDLAALCKASYLACKDEDPSIGVLWASRCSHAAFWRRALENGCGPYFEIMNQHSYGAPEDLFALIAEDRQMMADFGFQRPIWMTEMGCRTDPDPDGSYLDAERAEVSYLLRAHACGLASGIDRFFYFYLQEFLEYGIWLWGLLREDLSPKPAFVALGTLIRQLQDAHPIGWTQKERSYAVVLERAPGDLVAVAWSLDGGSLPFALGQGAYLVNAMGVTIRELAAGTITLPLSDQPLFVRGIDPSGMDLTPLAQAPHHVPNAEPATDEMHVWLQAVVRPDQPWPDFRGRDTLKVVVETEPGAREEIAFWAHNYGHRDASVALHIKLPQGWQTADPVSHALMVEAGTSQQIRLRLEVGALHADEVIPVEAQLTLNGALRDVARICYVARSK